MSCIFSSLNLRYKEKGGGGEKSNTSDNFLNFLTEAQLISPSPLPKTKCCEGKGNHNHSNHTSFSKNWEVFHIKVTDLLSQAPADTAESTGKRVKTHKFVLSFFFPGGRRGKI